VVDEIVLLGYSIARPVVYSVVEQLEREGLSPAGVVLVDSYWPRSEGLNRAMTAVIQHLV
jgi:thioesterase domain-containing protein